MPRNTPGPIMKRSLGNWKWELTPFSLEFQSSKHHRDSMILGVSKDSINLTRPKFNLRTSNKSSSIPPARHTISWVINHSPPDSSLKDLQEHFQTRYDSTKTKNSVQKNIIRASDLTQTTRRPATPVRYITEPQSRRCLEYLYGRTKSRTISACLLGQLQTVAIHVPIVVGLATDVRQSITPVQSGISLESSFSAFANQITHSSEPTLVTQESESR
ncbi:hypothetical protein DFH28DRAFT_1169673 [Melampsora americana]|nr:hypothetical protein DFH28DRAFT_1169673 [Melampsora americana]